ncbi:MAG: alpha/beta hydrolase [Polaromonas sp.]|nr:alpha/beta hydrolase [Polaromonas sp.]
MKLPGVEHHTLGANGMQFYVATAGPEDGPLVLLLHGFPEFSYGWRHQIAPLAAAGYRVAAPDLRGYGHSSKPAGQAAYRLQTLAQDVKSLALALGHERFSVVGHDWGGVLAWQLATHDAAAVACAAILNAPHPATLMRYALKNPLQLLRGSYIGFFQLPVLPEMVLRANNFQAMALALIGSSRSGTFSEADLAIYREAWGLERALTSMLNWYRAMPLAPSAASVPRVPVPVRVVWGDRDTALERGLAEEGLTHCDRGEGIHLPEATHWLHHEEPTRVNELLLQFLKAHARDA